MKVLYWIGRWIKSRNITSHAVAGVITTVALAYVSDEQVRSFVVTLLTNHPTVLAGITWAFILWLKYSSAHSAVGILQQVPAATAEVIHTDPELVKETAQQMTVGIEKTEGK